jgi:hypothetical protein
MGNHDRADGYAREKVEVGAVVSLRPALTSIKGACQYLGDIGLSKFYQDILPQLDVIKLGTRTLVTLRSLDRLIEANRQQWRADTCLPSIEGEPHHECDSATPATGSALLEDVSPAFRRSGREVARGACT